MQIVIFGANGATGRVLCRQALDAGHRVIAVTRHPADFPISDRALDVTYADACDRDSVTAAIDGADTVLSTLGVPFTRKPITVYSKGVSNIIDAMSRTGLKRLAVVSSSATEPHRHADGGLLMNYLLQPLVTATIGKTTYRDMREMEAIVRGSDLDWTIVRPSGLFDAPQVSDYRIDEDRAPGIFTSRADLASALLAQVDDTSFAQKTIAVTTVEGTPTLWQMLRREAFK